MKPTNISHMSWHSDLNHITKPCVHENNVPLSRHWSKVRCTLPSVNYMAAHNLLVILWLTEL